MKWGLHSRAFSRAFVVASALYTNWDGPIFTKIFILFEKCLFCLLLFPIQSSLAIVQQLKMWAVGVSHLCKHTHMLTHISFWKHSIFLIFLNFSKPYFLKDTCYFHFLTIYRFLIVTPKLWHCHLQENSDLHTKNKSTPCLCNTLLNSPYMHAIPSPTHFFEFLRSPLNTGGKSSLLAIFLHSLKRRQHTNKILSL